MSFINNLKSDRMLVKSIFCVFILAICHWIQFYRSGCMIQPLIRAICATCYIFTAVIFGRKSWPIVIFVWAMALVYFNRFCNFTSFVMILIAISLNKKMFYPYLIMYSLMVMASLYLYKDSYTHLIIHAGGCYFFYIVYEIVMDKIYPDNVIEVVGYNPGPFKKKKTEMVLSHFSTLGRTEKEKLITESPLNDREVNILVFRFVHGYSLKESAEKLNMEYDTFAKAQKRAIDKIHSYIFTE